MRTTGAHILRENTGTTGLEQTLRSAVEGSQWESTLGVNCRLDKWRDEKQIREMQARPEPLQTIFEPVFGL